MRDWQELAAEGRAWPFQEARQILKRLDGQPPPKGYVLFSTGYGPSGLPHIGTFGEVVRTSMVRHAFETLSDIPTKLICFSDDMDGLRKVPDNVPNPALLQANLGKSLTSVPDPFGTHDSFGAHNNARLRAFLDSFGFSYEFLSSTACYKSGRFDAALLRVLEVYDAVMDIMLPTLGEERRKTYSPFLPISPQTGRVLQVPILARDAAAGTITFIDEDGSEITQPVTGGHAKLQWKPDWAMRWYALEVDYEMSGKDLIDSVAAASKITRALGKRPPETFTYELFLDDQGTKISKSKGNGIAVEDWLRYAPAESLSLFMYGKPKAAKRLYFDVIPRAVDEYLAHLAKFPEQEPAQQIENPAWHIHNGAPPAEEAHLSFSILLNLASVVNAHEPGILWGFISRYAPSASPQTAPFLDKLVRCAIAYYEDFVLPTKRFRPPTEVERAALEELAAVLATLPPDSPAEDIQTQVYEIGKKYPFNELRAWFQALYQVLLGQDQGPRFGSFVALYGIAETRRLIEDALAGTLVSGGG